MKYFVIYAAVTVLIALCAFLARVFLLACREKNYIKAFWLKGAAGLCFVALGGITTAVHGGQDTSLLIFGGLLLGLLGDQLLALRFVYSKKFDLFFVAGTVSFALGHVLYCTALLIADSGALAAALIIAALGLAAAAVYTKRKNVNAGKFRTAGVAYIAIVTFMGALAVAAAARNPSVGTLLFALGGILFPVSDSILCVYSFGSDTRFGMNIAVHATYYAAQLSIALAILF